MTNNSSVIAVSSTTFDRARVIVSDKWTNGDLTPNGKFRAMFASSSIAQADCTPLHLIACMRACGMRKPVPVKCMADMLGDIRTGDYMDLYFELYCAIAEYNRNGQVDDSRAFGAWSTLLSTLTGGGIKPRQTDISELSGLCKVAKKDKDTGKYGRDWTTLDDFRFQIELNIALWMDGEKTTYGRYTKVAAAAAKKAKKDEKSAQAAQSVQAANNKDKTEKQDKTEK